VSLFALLAGGIAALGIYGAAAYALARRTREIGIRMALGATPHRVLSFALVQSLGPAAAGIALGWPLALGFAASLRGLLYATGPLDPRAHVLSALGLGTVTLLAGLVPARRALRISPAEVLRRE
jgi:ABC-type antimicrobial peptide transport system permease subunit